MNIFGCALQYCYIKFMLKVTKAFEKPGSHVGAHTHWIGLRSS